jgi:hypothetical protein
LRLEDTGVSSMRRAAALSHARAKYTSPKLDDPRRKVRNLSLLCGFRMDWNLCSRLRILLDFVEEEVCVPSNLCRREAYRVRGCQPAYRRFRGSRRAGAK